MHIYNIIRLFMHGLQSGFMHIKQTRTVQVWIILHMLITNLQISQKERDFFFFFTVLTIKLYQ